MTTTRSSRRWRSMSSVRRRCGALQKTWSTSSHIAIRTTGMCSKRRRGRWPNSGCRPNAAASCGSSRSRPPRWPAGCARFRCLRRSASTNCSGSAAPRVRCATSPGRCCCRRAAVPDNHPRAARRPGHRRPSGGAPFTIEAPATLGFVQALQGVAMRRTRSARSMPTVTLALTVDELRTLLADNTDSGARIVRDPRRSARPGGLRQPAVDGRGAGARADRRRRRAAGRKDSRAAARPGFRENCR